MFTLAGLVPEAKPIVEKAASIYVSETAPWFVGIIAHGSAVKGGFISGCSDIDLLLFLERAAFVEDHLPLQLCETVQRELAKINPAPFSYIQCYALSGEQHKDKNWAGPIPGGYRLLAGRLPIAEATREQLLDSAREKLARLPSEIAYYHAGLLQHGAGRVERHIRLLCTSVWPTLNHVLSLQQNNPIEVWNLTKLQAIENLPAQAPMGHAIRLFYQAITVYYPSGSSLDAGLEAVRHGISFLQAVNSWWKSHK